VFHFSNCPTSSFHFSSHDTKRFYFILFFSPASALCQVMPKELATPKISTPLDKCLFPERPTHQPLSYSLMTLWMSCRLWCQDEWHHGWESLEIRVKQYFAYIIKKKEINFLFFCQCIKYCNEFWSVFCPSVPFFWKTKSKFTGTTLNIQSGSSQNLCFFPSLWNDNITQRGPVAFISQVHKFVMAVARHTNFVYVEKQQSWWFLSQTWNEAFSLYLSLSFSLSSTKSISQVKLEFFWHHLEWHSGLKHVHYLLSAVGQYFSICHMHIFIVVVSKTNCKSVISHK
jgi:hypothetical protein